MTEAQQPRPGPPPPPPVSEVKLTDDIKETVNGAYTAGFPALVAYVDGDGQPSLSIRGSTITYSDTQLAIWLRNRDGGLLKALQSNPRISVLVRNNETRANLNFRTVGAPQDAAEVRSKVYESIPENERKADPEQKGLPLILEIERLDGRTPAGVYRMLKGGGS